MQWLDVSTALAVSSSVCSQETPWELISSKLHAEAGLCLLFVRSCGKLGIPYSHARSLSSHTGLAMYRVSWGEVVWSSMPGLGC